MWRRASAAVVLTLLTCSCSGAGRRQPATVDWDVESQDGATLHLVYYTNPGCIGPEGLSTDVTETPQSVTIHLRLKDHGDGDQATCATAYIPERTVVALASPLGDRTLLGCRDPRSHVPSGGYNDAEPRDVAFDCTASSPVLTTVPEV